LGVGGSAERALLVAALRMAARHGGRTADALDGVAGTVRDRTAVSAELAAQTSQARYSAWVLAALPPLFLALGSMVDPRLLGALASPGGVMALLGALAFELAGAAWIRRILSSGSRSIGHR
jgi:tight adherence protein B